MSDAWRCFVAVPLDDGLRTALASAIVSWRADPRAEQLRWVEREALHLTLAFLGSVEPERVEAIKDDVARVAERHAPIKRPTGRLGAFARPGSAHVLWYAVADPDGALAALAGDLAGALRLPSPDPFRPHVTLGRARRRPVDLRGWIEAASAAAPEGILAVRDLHLMRSHLGGGPARYETLARLPLGAHPQ
jgi:RNA 2',3'-cyclic 3'-phosphodiesterase